MCELKESNGRRRVRVLIPTPPPEDTVMILGFEDLCLMLYVTIDDHYRALPAALTATLRALRCRVLNALVPAHDRQCVVDSLPVPVIAFHRVPGANNAGRWRSWGADFGRVTTKKQTGALVY